jgi:hypothetical protein
VIIGIDFDNTIASYDDLMHQLAVGWGLVARDMPKNKRMIRDALRALPDGEVKWRRLQTHCYGPGMGDARPMDGVKEFLAACKQRGLPVWIVSHKTRLANFGEPVDLRAAAVDWMAQQRLFDAVPRERVFFEETRKEKIGRIRALGITHFIDDLEETFLEESFPGSVEQILYTAQPSHNGRWRSFATWRDIGQHLLGQ